MKIENYHPDHIAVCLAIFDSNKPMYFHEDERPVFQNFLNERPAELYYLLSQNDRIIACGGIYEDELDVAGLSWGMVHSDFHGKGFGRYLTQYRIKKLKEVFPDYRYKIETSQHTFRFYQKMGFKESHRIEDGFGLGLDKIVMWLE